MPAATISPTEKLERPPLIEMDYLVTMGCEETCSVFPTKKIIGWEIPDPKGKPIEFFGEVRDMIEDKIKALFEEIAMNILSQPYSIAVFMVRSLDKIYYKS